jgi:hypothetical protein
MGENKMRGRNMKHKKLYGVLFLGLVCILLVGCNLVSVESSDCFCSVDTDYTDVPVGQIFMWAQSPALLPSGWFVCNATNNAVNASIPVLESQFVAGYDSGHWDDDYDPPEWVQDVWYDTIGFQYGFKTVTVSIAQLPSHKHNWSFWSIGLAVLRPVKGGNLAAFGSRTSSSVGGDGAHENRPPYRTVYYVIYLGV